MKKYRYPSTCTAVLVGVMLCGSMLPSVFAQAQSPAAQQATPAQGAANSTEIEFWRSTDRMGTPEAYRAYLDAYPSGSFAALARLALSRVAPNAPAAAAAPAVPTPSSTAAGLRYFTQPADSGAVTLNIGDRHKGPTALTAGWLGARKQLVLPSGDWVVLSAADRKLALLSNVNATITTVTFGKFTGERLSTLLRFTFSSQVPSVSSWPDLAGCDRADAQLMHSARSQQGVRDECISLRATAQPMSVVFQGADELRASLDKLGAKVSGPALTTTITMADKRHGYWGLSRYDWPGASMGADADKIGEWRRDMLALPAAKAAYANGLLSWAERYRPHAVEGHRNDYNGPVATDTKAMSTDDFDPRALAAN